MSTDQNPLNFTAQKGECFYMQLVSQYIWRNAVLTWHNTDETWSHLTLKMVEMVNVILCIFTKKNYLVEPSFGFPEKQILRQGLQGLGFRLSEKWSQEASREETGKVRWRKPNARARKHQGPASICGQTVALPWVPGGPWLKSISLENRGGCGIYHWLLFPIYFPETCLCGH